MKILDTHVGSASSLIAYEECGLEYVGYEINEDYYNDAHKRLEEFRSQITLFDLGMEEHKRVAQAQDLEQKHMYAQDIFLDRANVSNTQISVARMSQNTFMRSWHYIRTVCC